MGILFLKLHEYTIGTAIQIKTTTIEKYISFCLSFFFIQNTSFWLDSLKIFRMNKEEPKLIVFSPEVENAISSVC